MQEMMSSTGLDGLLTPVSMLFEILGEAAEQASLDQGAHQLAWRSGFLDGFKAVGLSASAQGLKSVSHLASLMGPYLRQSKSPTDLEQAQVLATSLFSFFAGELSAEESGQLYQQLADWVAPVTPLPASIARIVTQGLAADATVLQNARLARQEAEGFACEEPEDFASEEVPTLLEEASENALDLEDEPIVGLNEASGAESEMGVSPEVTSELGLDAEIASEELQVDDDEQGMLDEDEELLLSAGEEEQASGPSTVALDELEMVAEAWSDFVDAIVFSLSQQNWDDPAQASQRADVLSDAQERMGNIANALRFMTLEQSALGLDALAMRLGELSLGELCNAEHQAALMSTVLAWSDSFKQRDEAGFAAAVQTLQESVWSLEGVNFEACQLELTSLRVIQSRQVSLRETALEGEELSLAIPQDADSNVVDQLLRELPQLSAEFSEQIEAVVAGDLDSLGEARRIAHTIKGSANTVGVRGIANLTHALEDLLQILADEERLPEPALAELLSVASDCVAEASEAVSGQGSAPENLGQVYAELSEQINHLVAAKLGETSETDVDQDASHEASGVDADSEGLGPHAVGETVQGASTQVTSTALATAPVDDAQGKLSSGDKQVEGDEKPEDETLRVPGRVLERLVEHTTDTALLLSQAQDRVVQMDQLRQSLRWGGDRLQELADELERLVDLRGLSISGRQVNSDFDALEMDEYNELHTLSRRIAEASADARLIQQQIEQGVTGLRDNIEQIDRVQVEVRDSAMQTRMVPAATIVPRLQRAARQASRMVGKAINMRIVGESTTIEGQLLQQMVDALGHIIRNSIDHGLEASSERQRLGKPEIGQLELSFKRLGSSIEIAFSDDGAGLNLPRIREKAVSLGLASAEQAKQADERQIAQWIMLPGFSTKTETTQLSGRGIGMDVVAATVRKLRGQISIETQIGVGTQIRVQLPIRMSTVPVLIAKGATQSFALSVRGLSQLLSTENLSQGASGEWQYAFQDQTLKAFRLEELIGLQSFALRPPSHEVVNEVVVLVRGTSGDLYAVVVPELGQTRNVVLRPMPSYMPTIPGIEGAAVLGNGMVAPVLDLPELVDTSRDGARAPSQSLMPTVQSQSLCMIVDDSVSVRRSTELFVRDMGLEALSPSDGMHAVELLQKRVPDLFLLDMEMPRMNGVELARAIRADARLASKPIIMITSRNSQKHRDLAQSAGVDVFLTKPFTEDVLSQHIEECLAGKYAMR